MIKIKSKKSKHTSRTFRIGNIRCLYVRKIVVRSCQSCFVRLYRSENIFRVNLVSNHLSFSVDKYAKRCYILVTGFAVHVLKLFP